MSQINITIRFTVDEDDVNALHSALFADDCIDHSDHNVMNKFVDLIQQAMYDEGPQLEGEFVTVAVGETK
jgi:hypothetical protein